MLFIYTVVVGNIHGLVVDYILLRHYVVLMNQIVVQIGNLAILNLVIITKIAAVVESSRGGWGEVVGWRGLIEKKQCRKRRLFKKEGQVHKVLMDRKRILVKRCIMYHR